MSVFIIYDENFNTFNQVGFNLNTKYFYSTTEMVDMSIANLGYGVQLIDKSKLLKVLGVDETAYEFVIINTSKCVVKGREMFNKLVVNLVIRNSRLWKGRGCYQIVDIPGKKLITSMFTDDLSLVVKDKPVKPTAEPVTKTRIEQIMHSIGYLVERPTRNEVASVLVEWDD